MKNNDTLLHTYTEYQKKKTIQNILLKNIENKMGSINSCAGCEGAYNLSTVETFPIITTSNQHP